MSLLSLDKVSSHPSVQRTGTNETLPDAARLMAVLDGSGLGVWSWDLADTEQWSAGTAKLFGFFAEQIPPGSRYLQLVVEEDRASVEARLRSVIAGETANFTIRHRALWPDSSLHWLELIGQRQIDACGQTILVGLVRDISAEHLQAQELEDSQERLGLALNSVELGTWDWHSPATPCTPRHAPLNCRASPKALITARSRSSSPASCAKTAAGCARPIANSWKASDAITR